MDRRIIDALPGIVKELNNIIISDTKAFLGFDACIDYIVRIVKDKKDNGTIELFSSSKQFGEFLINLDNRSSGVELTTKLSKIGGNMVIMGNALGNLGVKIECVGTFGFPDILPVFRSISKNCNLHTIGDTISATALEFEVSKVIVFDPGPYNNLTWEGIRDFLGIDRIKELLEGKQLISFLNWSEIENSSLIWKGFLTEVIPLIEKSDVRPVFFTDFSDCSRKSGEDIRYAVSLLREFRNYYRVVFSLNQNEALLIADAFGLNQSDSDSDFIKSLYDVVNSDILTIHMVNDSIAYDGISFESCDTFFCEEPVLLTGGGDNFNAGFCFALLLNLNLFQTLLVANAVSGAYVASGISPDVNSLIGFLNLKQSEDLEL